MKVTGSPLPVADQYGVFGNAASKRLLSGVIDEGDPGLTEEDCQRSAVSRGAGGEAVILRRAS